MSNFFFNENSFLGKFFFNFMLKGLEHPFRYKINNPEKIVKASGINPGQVVLEIGCGSGFFTIYASKELGDSGFLFSIDLHPTSIKETLFKVKKYNLDNVKVSKQNAMQTNFKNNKFDLVLLYGVIPAPGIISTKKILDEIYRILKPEGKLAIWTAVPFWSKKTILKNKFFSFYKKNDGVYLFLKK
jgi:demethylmenaquinone methyltransferase/2-methoxy-6-polyprenyl-1,4-benzoquinol methylase